MLTLRYQHHSKHSITLNETTVNVEARSGRKNKKAIITVVERERTREMRGGGGVKGWNVKRVARKITAESGCFSFIHLCFCLCFSVCTTRRHTCHRSHLACFFVQSSRLFCNYTVAGLCFSICASEPHTQFPISVQQSKWWCIAMNMNTFVFASKAHKITFSQMNDSRWHENA